MRGNAVVRRRTTIGLNPTAVRLRLLRAAIYGENSVEFARRLNISVSRLLNMENGLPLSISVANKIRAAVPGVSLDWLYHGDERALPMAMVDKLKAASAALERDPG
jgi:hypothetical protein